MVGDAPGEARSRDPSRIGDSHQFEIRLFEHDEPVGRAERVGCLGGDDEPDLDERRRSCIEVDDRQDQVIELDHAVPVGIVLLRVER